MSRVLLFAFVLFFSGLISADQKGLERLPVQQFTQGSKVAVLVGVSTYVPQNTGFTPLSYADRDMNLLEQTLKGKGYEVVKLVNHHANKNTILNKISQMGKLVKPNEGTLLFAFSGHGFTERGQPTRLATYDTHAEDLARTGLSIPELVTAIRATRVRRAMLFIDACRNNPTVTKSGIRSGPQQFDYGEGIKILYSTKHADVSIEPTALKQGVFSYFLNHGLRGKAEENGVITFASLARYVETEVRLWTSRNTHITQQPFRASAGDYSGDFVLSHRPVKTQSSTVVSSHFGFLSVFTDVPKHEVKFIGEQLSFTQGMKLESGKKYEIEVSSQGFEPEKRVINLSSGENLKAVVLLKFKKELDRSVEQEAKVYADKKYIDFLKKADTNLDSVKSQSGKSYKDFTVDNKYIASRKRLVALVISSESMEDSEKQYWFNLLDVMNEDQIRKLYDIQEREFKKLAAIDYKYDPDLRDSLGLVALNHDLRLAEQAVKVNPQSSNAYYNRANAYSKKKDYVKAMGDYKKALSLDPFNSWARNSLSWALSTSKDNHTRNGEEALRLAINLVQLERNPIYIDTLAAAYAETGDFTNAIKEQLNAIRILKSQNKNKELRDGEYYERLTAYKENKPWRE